MSGPDYRRAWASTDASALEVNTRSGADVAAVRRAIEGLLGPASALSVQTSGERAAQADALARQGLSRMSQITLLLMIAAALAMAAAIGAGIWQRRASLASLRIHSFSPWQLRGVLTCESILVLGTGGLVGAARRHLRSSAVRSLPQAHHRVSRAVRRRRHSHDPDDPADRDRRARRAGDPGYMASQAPPQLALQD